LIAAATVTLGAIAIAGRPTGAAVLAKPIVVVGLGILGQITARSC